MLIICPNCASSYLIRATEIGAEGRLVRCGSCQNSWHVSSFPSDPLETGEVSDEPVEIIDENLNSTGEAPSRQTGQTRRRVAFGGLAAAAIASLFIMPIGKIADVARSLISRVVPTDRFAGLDFSKVSSQLVAENDEIVLVVEGEIIAKSGERRSMPGLALTIRGEGQDQIFRWTVKPPAETISAGAPIPFKVRLASPPITGREVLIRFVDASEVGDASAS